MKTKIRFLKNALLVDEKILVFGDVHIGFEEHIVEDGLMPMVQFKNILKDIKEIFSLLDDEGIVLKKIVILGDLKHEFGGISDSEWRNVLKFLDVLSERVRDIILIKGNHDNILGVIARKRNVKLKNFWKYKEICFLHGHRNFKNCFNENVKVLVMGHLHPAVTLSDKYKKEKYKCFLKGKWKGKLIYILPSFSEISFGYDVSDINDEDSDGFLIVPHKVLKRFRVLVYRGLEDGKGGRKQGFGKGEGRKGLRKVKQEKNIDENVLDFGKIKK